ncbi:6-pyruvoyl trahydropterin synthase family protein [Deinococcus cellulosilyticus]|uniref:6-carboxy-5,6,7,8-tetrahydropterin synthase n=1 Tax=Deinococcus cellulosilyticus (strain DSM 18568 / NBRC 106333 / KACC 11606 / 5516J-15) TaxID=1223518 RepID=A0A511MZX5_DEIC1|nr:6-carboxytetrahydropterin synthase [Deinococcus cellulosilyticus]GEM46144.1 6-carboxy-5,6,7,8-tetrahydropterin synthase [Deinococcus cellulosilyticus NBRC 106333 = KACC 11606]
MLTCIKEYKDIPFAHRQYRHEGHCAFIHGHNWNIKITFKAATLDQSGFVMDFGKLKPIRNWIDHHLDHACLLSSNDPLLDTLLAFNQQHHVFKLLVLEDVSCEGLAQHLWQVFSSILQQETGGRVAIHSIEVFENKSNAVVFTPQGVQG